MFFYDGVKLKIKRISPAELELHGVITPAKTSANGEKTYICPLCGNGTGRDASGIAFKFEGGVYLAKCFKCGAGFDNIDLLALHYGLQDDGKDFVELLQKATVEFSLPADFQSHHNLEPMTFNTPKKIVPVKSAEEIAKEKAKTEMILADIKEAQKHLKELPLVDGLWRGLTIETLQFFNCGYLANWTSPAARLAGVKYSTPTPRVIIPSGEHYLARLIVPLDNFKNAPDFEFIKDKPHAGTKGVFGIHTIKGKTFRTADAAPLENSTGNSAINCTIALNDGNKKSRSFADFKSFSIVPKKPVNTDDVDLNAEAAILNIVTIKSADNVKKFFLPNLTTNFTIASWTENLLRLSITTLTGKKQSFNFRINAQEVLIEKIYNIFYITETFPPANSKIVIEDNTGKILSRSLPADISTITLERETVDDFLDYTLKIFETTEFEKIESSEPDEDYKIEVEVPATKYVFVFEGEINAMAAFQKTNNEEYAFIATGGAAESKWINTVDARCQELNIKPNFLIKFDNDDAGRTNADKVAATLKKRGYSALVKLVGGTDNGK